MSAWTHSTYAHPDEWFKTVEIAEYFVRGVATYCQEIALHYTNLVWPFLLTIPLQFAAAILPESLHFKVFAFQFFTGLLDLGLVWGWWSLLEGLNLDHRRKNAAMMLLLFPWFLVHDSIRPTSEHVSAIAFWITLGLLARKRHFAAGVFAVLIAAFRYPSALLSLGVTIGVFFNSDRRAKRDFSLGLLLGVILGGLPDWMVYGRPWESFWMYLQYNIFTGLSHIKFGAQSPLVYWDFIYGRWFKWNWIAGLGILGLGTYGLVQGLKRRQTWAFALICFLVGHLAVAHKESRFVSPVEILFLWAELTGFLAFSKNRPEVFSRQPLIVLVRLALVINLIFFTKALWGETWTLSLNYLELPLHLREFPDTCGVITPKRMTSVVYTGAGNHVPDPPLGVSLYGKSSESFRESTHMPVVWIDHPAHCTPEQSLLIQSWAPDPKWDQAGCELLASGFLRVLPQNLWSQALSHPGMVGGPWYRCPAKILKLFGGEVTERTLFERMKPIETLPKLGASPEEILQFDRSQSPEPDCKWLCPG